MRGGQGKLEEAVVAKPELPAIKRYEQLLLISLYDVTYLSAGKGKANLNMMRDSLVGQSIVL